MAHYTRPVKQDVDLVVAYPLDRDGYPSGRSVLHVAGCSHAAGSRTVREASPVPYDHEGVYADDWYEVAPCAANGKGAVDSGKKD